MLPQLLVSDLPASMPRSTSGLCPSFRYTFLFDMWYWHCRTAEASIGRHSKSRTTEKQHFFKQYREVQINAKTTLTKPRGPWSAHTSVLPSLSPAHHHGELQLALQKIPTCLQSFPQWSHPTLGSTELSGPFAGADSCSSSHSPPPAFHGPKQLLLPTPPPALLHGNTSAYHKEKERKRDHLCPQIEHWNTISNRESSSSAIQSVAEISIGIGLTAHECTKPSLKAACPGL